MFPCRFNQIELGRLVSDRALGLAGETADRAGYGALPRSGRQVGVRIRASVMKALTEPT